MCSSDLFVVLVILQSCFRFSFGPQHPASHGVLVLLVAFCGDFTSFVDVFIGFLHRGSECVSAFRVFDGILGYVDRFDYCSVVACEFVFVLAFESLAFSCVFRCRFGLLELVRCFNGLLVLACGFLDIGSVSALLWLFDDRELLCVVFEFVVGVRLHVGFLASSGCVLAFSRFSFFSFSSVLLFSLVVIESGLIGFRVVFSRLRGVGVVLVCFVSVVSGILLRSFGFSWDIRFAVCFDSMAFRSFSVVSSSLCCSFDRFVLRLLELRVSVGLFLVCCFGLVVSFCVAIESLIFCFVSVFFGFSSVFSVSFVEHPKGEYGCLLVSVVLVFRVRFRCCDFVHCLGIVAFVRGLVLGDLVVVISVFDVVFGSVDR